MTVKEYIAYVKDLTNFSSEAKKQLRELNDYKNEAGALVSECRAKRMR